MHLDKYSIFLSTVKINEPQKVSDNKIARWILFSLAEILTQQSRPVVAVLTASGQQLIDTKRHAAKYTTHIAKREMASLGNDTIM